MASGAIAISGCRSPHAATEQRGPRPRTSPLPPLSITHVPPVPAIGCGATAARSTWGPGTTHGARIFRNETWTAEGNPHHLAVGGTVITEGASLAVLPCTVVVGGPDDALVVARGGALFAQGELGREIRFAPDAVGSSWAGVRFERGARPTSRIGFATIEAGGSAQVAADAACLDDAMDDLDVVHVAFVACRTHGVALRGGARIDARSGALRFSVNVGAAVWTDTPRSAASVPASTYEHNGVDGVVILDGPDAESR